MSLGTKIFKIVCCVILFILFIVSIIIVVVILKKVERNAIYRDRAENCLEIYNNYTIINQNPIPNGGQYYNEFFKENKYYGLRDFYYAASYKSYLPCGYTNDVVSYNAIKNVLLYGARVINLDIFYEGANAFSDDAKIIVGNVIDNKLSFLEGTSDDKQYLEFMNCLELIDELGWKKTDAPLFLYLNMEFDPNTGLEYQIFSQLSTKLAKYFMENYYSFQSTNIGDIPVNKALNKLIILTNRKPIDSSLNEITNGIMSEDSTNIILYTFSDAEISYGGIKTKFAKKEDAIEVSMYNLVAVIKKSDINSKNKYIQKIDSTNYDASINFDLGISMSFMNWQTYPKEYLDRFSNGGMLLKPLSLIYIPKPKPPVYERDRTYDYKNTRVTGLDGFYDFEI